MGLKIATTHQIRSYCDSETKENVRTQEKKAEREK